MNFRITIFLFSLLVVSCQQTTYDEREVFALRNQADSIASISQKVLIQNVTAALQNGGAEYAVDFCHISAIPITDSLSKEYQMSIQRITDKHRNPDNNLKTKMDYSIFDEFKRKSDLSDTLLREKDHFVYYKRINLAMPTCLQCHGNPTTDITEKTLQKLSVRYPNDQAVDYSLNEFRGLWKIKLSQ